MVLDFTPSVIEGIRVGASGKETRGDGDRIFVWRMVLAGYEWSGCWGMSQPQRQRFQVYLIFQIYTPLGTISFIKVM